MGWNGFAGEGISVTSSPPNPYQDYVATFPGGSCTIFPGGPGASLHGAMPSPNGKLIALAFSNNDIPYVLLSGIEILSLRIASTQRDRGSTSPGSSRSPLPGASPT